MFKNINISFLLMTTAAEFSASQQQKLIIPGIIFSVGAIMLILCVLVSNIQRRKKLADAERLKRERIKKFSEEANMRYANVSQSDDSLRQKKIVTESVAPTQASYNATPNQMVNQIKMQTVESQRMQTMQQVQMQMPQMSSQPSMPQMQTMQVQPQVPSANVVPSMPQVRTSQPVQNAVPSMPQSQPTMGGTPLPGMASGYIQNSNEPKEENTDIAAMVRKRVQEIEEQKRNQIINNKTPQIIKDEKLEKDNLKNGTQEKNINENQNSNQEQKQNENSNNDSTNQSENKTEEIKKPFKFEYKPEYKPGQEPANVEKIELSLKPENKEENKEENKAEEKVFENKSQENNQVEKIENKNENKTENENQSQKVDEQKIETNEKEINKPILTTIIKTISLDDKTDNKENKNNDVIDENEDEDSQPKTLNNLSHTIPVPKLSRIQTEQSAEFYKAEQKINEVKQLNDDEIKKQNELIRQPQVTKIKTKKIEYNVGLLREVQTKLNLSREYDQAMSLKEEEKNKLKEEFLEKRMNLNSIKAKLEQEKANKLEQEKKTREQITKSLEESSEKGITYEAGKKVSLFNTENQITKQLEQTLEENDDNKNIQEVKTNEEVEEKVQEKVEEEIHNDNYEDESKKENEKQIEDKKSKTVSQLDKLFDAINEENSNENKVEKTSKLERTNRLKEIVNEIKKPEVSSEELLNTKLEKKEDDIQKVIKNITAMENANQVINNISNDQQRQNESSSEEDIKNRIKKVVDEEKKRKEELLKAEMEERQAKLKVKENANQRTKSILNGVDVESEILNKNSKHVPSFSDAPIARKVISVLSPEGCGKTTIAVNLAYELANRGLKVCLIDTDNLKKDVYYYIHQEHIGCLSRLTEFESVEDMYNVGIKINDRLTVFTENKGIEYELNFNKLYKLIAYAQSKNDAVILDFKQTLGQEKSKELLKMSTNVLVVIDKKITTLNRIADKFARIKGGFINKNVSVVINMDEGRGINKIAVKSIFKHLEYIENNEKKSYAIKIGEIFTIGYDTKSIITGLISQQPAVVVPENKMIGDIKKIASYIYDSKN